MTFAFPGPVFFKSLLAPGAPPPGRAECVAILLVLRRLSAAQRRTVLLSLPEPAVKALEEEWWWQAHGGQVEPPGDWRIWSIVAGRGFGKTRAGAEWVWQRARDHPGCRIALVGGTADEVAEYQIEGDSGLLAIARSDERPRWQPSKGRFFFPSGAVGFVRTAERPAKLRGAQHHFAWCDELAKWPRAGAVWDNLMFGLRLGAAPRAVVTTTPLAVPALKRILSLPRSIVTHGRTDENPNNAPDFITAMYETYGGTRLGRQELDGILFEDFPDALWTRDLLEKARGSSVIARSEATRQSSGAADSEAGLLRCARHDGIAFTRIVVGLDPPASTGGNSCGILVCGMDDEGVAWVLADLTAHGLSPEAWARRVADAAALYGAGLVVAEKNQGGDMIAAVLRAVDSSLPVRLVPATRSKAARAEPIALRFETGRARLAGHFPELEDQLCALTWSGYQGPGSPDRADAMVWAMIELFERERTGPRIAML